MGRDQTIIIGAGIAGLSAAISLAAHGLSVTVLEKGPAAGGKLRQVNAGGKMVDAGPTVFTMRWVFEELFADAGADFADFVRASPATVLARHAWDETQHLDLFADQARSVDSVGAFAGPINAAGYLAFSKDAARIYHTLRDTFIAASRPSPFGLAQRVGIAGLGDLWNIKPFKTMWQALGGYFTDPRLRQLFGRYATYCGSSPFDAPATLMLVAHVEAEGVWLIDGGMIGLAQALERLATQLGVRFVYNTGVDEIIIAQGNTTGVIDSDGTHHRAAAVIANTDATAFAAGHLGAAVRHAAPAVELRARSLSAVTWAMDGAASGFPLSRHNVFFSNDYAAEFKAIFRDRRLPEDPTVYVCAQDRDDTGKGPANQCERLFCLVNAPAIDDHQPLSETELRSCDIAMRETLARCGLKLTSMPEQTHVTTPTDFAALFPGSGGALYGRASHGWAASFQRPGSRSKVPGLYLAGGSVHPGPGVPMAALSGRMAAQALMADRTSRRRSPVMAIAGGISTP